MGYLDLKNTSKDNLDLKNTAKCTIFLIFFMRAKRVIFFDLFYHIKQFYPDLDNDFFDFFDFCFAILRAIFFWIYFTL